MGAAIGLFDGARAAARAAHPVRAGQDDRRPAGAALGRVPVGEGMAIEPRRVRRCPTSSSTRAYYRLMDDFARALSGRSAFARRRRALRRRRRRHVRRRGCGARRGDGHGEGWTDDGAGRNRARRLSPPTGSSLCSGTFAGRRKAAKSIRHGTLWSVKRVVTIGVYEWDLERFLAALAGAEVRVLLDVRQRRGVRGREYAWANSLRLQDALAAAGIAYQHHLELAPTTALRQAQYAEDARRGSGSAIGRRWRRSTARGTRGRSSTAPTSRRSSPRYRRTGRARCSASRPTRKRVTAR